MALQLTPGDDDCRIVVSDEGPGTEPEQLEHVFERFYRVDKAKSRKQGGTGLGLSIGAAVAAAHGGAASVKSTLGQGTCFTVTLPHGPEPQAAGIGEIPLT